MYRVKVANQKKLVYWKIKIAKVYSSIEKGGGSASFISILYRKEE